MRQGSAGSVIIGLAILAVAACGPDRNPLAKLPAFIAPPADPPKCQPVPSSTDVILPVKGPFTLCKGSFASREAFAVMRDSARRTVWFARSWRAMHRPKAVAVFDSLSRQMVQRYGAVTVCDSLHRVWWVQEFSLELSLNAMSDVVRRPDLELPWWVHFNGQVEVHEGVCHGTRAGSRTRR